MKSMRRYINLEEMRVQVEGHRVASEAINKLDNVVEDGHDKDRGAVERTVRLHGLDDGGGVLVVVGDQVKHGVVKRLGLEKIFAVAELFKVKKVHRPLVRVARLDIKGGSEGLLSLTQFNKINPRIRTNSQKSINTQKYKRTASLSQEKGNLNGLKMTTDVLDGTPSERYETERAETHTHC